MVAKWNWSPCLQSKSVLHMTRVNLIFTHILKTLQWLWKTILTTEKPLACIPGFISCPLFSYFWDEWPGAGTAGAGLRRGPSGFCSTQAHPATGCLGWAKCAPFVGTPACGAWWHVRAGSACNTVPPIPCAPLGQAFGGLALRPSHQRRRGRKRLHAFVFFFEAVRNEWQR